MPVTGQQTFELSLALIDEVTRAGTIDLSDDSLKAKALKFLTIIQAELMPAATINMIVSDLANELLLTEREALLVAPYGLAAHLTIQDDATSASYFQQRYEELRKKKKAKIGPTIRVTTINGRSVNIDVVPEDDSNEGDLDGGTW